MKIFNSTSPVTQNQALRKTLSDLNKFRGTDSSILITVETSGDTEISSRKDQTFIKQGYLRSGTFGSELLGLEKILYRAAG